MTEKLFWQDPYQTEFTASVTDQFPVEGGHGIVLDRTLFYATSGGQPNDIGTLNAIPVKDVRFDSGKLVHVLAAKVEDTSVHGVLDWARRFDHMQQHSGQHILSAAFYRLFHAETSSFHLGEEFCSIELSRTDLKEAQIAEAEKEANQVIFAGTPVHSFFVDPQKADEYPLRKKSDLTESLRLIQIGNFDLSPCSGTHVKNSAEVGTIFVYSFEKLSGTTKIVFLCGNRVRKVFHHHLAILKKLSKSLTTSFDLLPESIAKLQGQIKEARKELMQHRENRLNAEAMELVMKADQWKENHLILQAWKRPYEEVRYLAQKLAEQSEVFGILASLSDQRIVFFKHPSVQLDLKPLFQTFLAKTGARGGGPSHFLEAGNVPTEDLESLIRSLF